jgi:hypothetical protein
MHLRALATEKAVGWCVGARLLSFTLVGTGSLQPTTSSCLSTTNGWCLVLRWLNPNLKSTNRTPEGNLPSGLRGRVVGVRVRDKAIEETKQDSSKSPLPMLIHPCVSIKAVAHRQA